MSLPLRIQFFFLENSLLVKQSLRESMIFAFDPFCFSFALRYIQTGWSNHWQFNWLIARSLFRNLNHRTPLATRNLDEFVEQKLVVFIDGNVPFVWNKVLDFFTVFSAFLHNLRNFVWFLQCSVRSRDLLNFLLMFFHFPARKWVGRIELTAVSWKANSGFFQCKLVPAWIIRW